MVVADHAAGSVVTDGAQPILVQAVPAFPDRGSTHPHLIQPGGTFGVHQHPVGGVCVAVVQQGKQNIGGTGEACADAVIVILHQFCQVGGSGLFVRPIQHTKIQRQHIAGLKLLGEFSVFVHQQALVSIRHPAAQLPIFGGLLLLAQQLTDAAEHGRGIAQACRGRPLGTGLPLGHFRHIRRHPVAEMEHRRGVPDVSLLSKAKEICPEFAGLYIPLHGIIGFFQNMNVSAGRKPVALGRDSIGNAAGLELLRTQIPEPFSQEPGHIEIEDRSGSKHGDVPRPAHPFIPLGAVRGNLHEIGAGTPPDVFIQPVQQLTGAGEGAVFLNVRIDRPGTDLQILPLDTLYGNIAEAHVGKPGGIFLHAVPADVGQGGFGTAQEGDVQISVGFQNLRVANGDRLTFLSVNF